ncbi:hypothetical protein [Methylorubrum extorquens]|uniref:hypothetical protein n=1 Tax=Methylorubrum extorquens TaxID=408 RepID=UPI00209E7FF7|nr:hypothetical protein [Methylorubrum extorquens]MCP1540117.1 putative nuclease with TOPRIM domain [Methylorubrum extorquens]
MEPFSTILVTGLVCTGMVGAAAGVSKILMIQAKQRVEEYEARAEETIDNRAHEILTNYDRIRSVAMRTSRSVLERFGELLVENESLEEMVAELREERDDLSTEIAALKVDAAEHSRVADAYSKELAGADDVISALTYKLNNQAVPLTLASPKTDDAHLDSLIRTEAKLKAAVNYGPGTIGRASDLERAA